MHEIWQALKPELLSNPEGKSDAIEDMDWPQLRSCAQELANEMMHWPDVETAIQKLRSDQSKLGALAFLTKHATADQRESAMRRAYEDTKSEAVILPMTALCAFLAELRRETEEK